ncbi:MAG: hypothetical protein ACRC3H_00720 [Lachnospiraceae bacterium]
MSLEKNTEKKIQPIEFLWLGLYTFAGFSLELILGLIINLLGMNPLGRGANSVLTGIIWFAVSFIIMQYSKKRFAYDVFEIREKLSIQKCFIILGLIVIITIATFVGFGGFKPLVELSGDSQGNIITYLLQLFYYLGESSLIVLSIAFGQQFCEKQFSLSVNTPSGGLFLAVTWGVMHFFLQGISGGAFTILFSVLAGIIYVICGKDFRWSYLFIAIAFIL